MTTIYGIQRRLVRDRERWINWSLIRGYQKIFDLELDGETDLAMCREFNVNLAKVDI
jgi:hypothetical protein